MTIGLGNAAAKWIATGVTEANFKYKTRTRVTRRIRINEDKDESEKKRKRHGRIRSYNIKSLGTQVSLSQLMKQDDCRGQTQPCGWNLG